MNFPLQGEERLIDPGARLRLLWEQRNIVVMPGVFNAALARLAQFHGYEALYISGAGVTNSLLGLPDHAFISLPEMAQVCNYITAAISIPAIADADTGYGGALQTARAVQMLERAGLAGIHIEDQVSPKRCGHLEGKEVIPTEEMVAKLKAAVQARSNPNLLCCEEGFRTLRGGRAGACISSTKSAHEQGPEDRRASSQQSNPNFIIIARTDARAIEGLDGAIERAKRYLNAGADAIFPEALQLPDEFERFARAVPAPLLANMTEFGKTPYLTVNEFAQLGYKMAIFPMSCFRAMMKAAEQVLLCLKQHGTQTPMLDAMQTRAELYELLEYDRYLRYDQQLAQE